MLKTLRRIASTGIVSESSPDADAALRLRRDILANSDIGVMALNKDASGAGYNRVIGFDANFRFFRNFNINSQATKTFSPAGAVKAGELAHQRGNLTG